MSGEDLYAVLGVPRTASEAEIRKAYRKIARDNHPDRNPDDAAAEARFKKASYASEVLLNSKKRKLYDEFGEIGLRDGFDADGYRAATRGGGFGGRGGFGGQGGFGGDGAVNLEDLFRAAGGAGGGGGPFGGAVGPDFMEAIFGGRGGGAQARAPKRDLVAEITVGFLEALQGSEKEITLSPPGGQRNLRVRIPKGVKDGGKVRLRGQGYEGGDLLLEVHVKPHPHFERDGNDLLLQLPVTVGEAINGAKVQVPTLEGEVALRVPAGVQSGTKLRLRGKGASRGKQTGDLIVTVMIHVPKAEAAELEELARSIDEHYAEHPRKGLHL